MEALSLQAQFERVILWYLQQYEWADWYSWCARIARALQQEQRALWSYFLARQNSRIEFGQFLSGLREYFQLDNLLDDPSHAYVTRWAVEKMLVKDLRLFGLLAVENGTPRRFSDDEVIAALKPTALGVHIFTLALADFTPAQIKEKRDTSVS